MKKVIIENGRVNKCIILEKDGEFVFRSGPGEFHENVRDYFRINEPELKEWKVRGGGRVRPPLRRLALRLAGRAGDAARRRRGLRVPDDRPRPVTPRR